MSTCFVIQPFDRGRFDKRFEDTFGPAIIAAGFKPYRVDQDPASVVPIEDIESGIRRADACFAEITTDNPNVWFELGFAIAARKPVVIVCSEDRDRFPFDVQHRSIIRYKSESPRDFQDLGEQITRRLRAAMETQRRVGAVEEISPAAPTQGLTDYELVALIIIAANGLHGDPVTTYTLRQEMERAIYAPVACTLAVRGLTRKGYIEQSDGYNGSNEYWGYCATDAGLDWLENNRERVKLKATPKTPPPAPAPEEDDLPF